MKAMPTCWHLSRASGRKLKTKNNQDVFSVGRWQLVVTLASCWTLGSLLWPYLPSTDRFMSYFSARNKRPNVPPAGMGGPGKWSRLQPSPAAELEYSEMNQSILVSQSGNVSWATNMVSKMEYTQIYLVKVFIQLFHHGSHFEEN